MIDSLRSEQLELEFPVTSKLAFARFEYYGRVVLHRLAEDEAGGRPEREGIPLIQVFYIVLAILSGAGIAALMTGVVLIRGLR